MADFNNPHKDAQYEALLADIRELFEVVATLSDSRATPPANMPNLLKRWDDANSRLQEWNGTAWAAKLISLAGGGTGASTASGARSNLSVDSSAEVTGKITTHNDVTDAHSATSAATANRIIRRDSSGRARVSAPSHADDIARKADIEALTGKAIGHVPKYEDDGSGNPVIRPPYNDKAIGGLAQYEDDSAGNAVISPTDKNAQQEALGLIRVKMWNLQQEFFDVPGAVVSGVTIDGNGNLIYAIQITGTSIDSIYVFDGISESLTKSFLNPVGTQMEDFLHGLTINPSTGDLIAGSASGADVYIIDIETEALKNTIDISYTTTQDIIGVALDLDGNLIVATSDNKIHKFIGISNTFDATTDLDSIYTSLQGIVIDPETGNLVAGDSASPNSLIRIHDGVSDTVLQKFKYPTTAPKDVCFSLNNFLVSGDGDDAIIQVHFTGISVSYNI